ncbi:hypothetical protein HPB52_011838 [Rhipicephalus sanguineus]|uniref:Uncharacterized protein n=1 Tax=Rhipicephalus sanguineus TaxID=34632 RepID=A0A9D4PKL2_RHISA|nr:hypothetical protein HPB52_011838 [Rhipicephalus sanguineus]
MPDSVAFVDATKYPNYKHYVEAVTHSTYAPKLGPDHAEQPRPWFCVGSVCKEADSVLSRAAWTDTKHLIWFTGHMAPTPTPSFQTATSLPTPRRETLLAASGERAAHGPRARNGSETNSRPVMESDSTIVSNGKRFRYLTLD